METARGTLNKTGGSPSGAIPGDLGSGFQGPQGTETKRRIKDFHKSGMLRKVHGQEVGKCVSSSN